MLCVSCSVFYFTVYRNQSVQNTVLSHVYLSGFSHILAADIAESRGLIGKDSSSKLEDKWMRTVTPACLSLYLSRSSFKRQRRNFLSLNRNQKAD